MSQPDLAAVALRPFTDADLDAVVTCWLDAGRAEYSYLPMFQALTPDAARDVFAEHILPGQELTVAEKNDSVVGYMARNGELIDRLYVAPTAQGHGVGSALLNQAKQGSSGELKLFTHQANERARTFYIGHGFRAVRFGISPAPECVPDVEYHWQRTTHR